MENQRPTDGSERARQRLRPRAWLEAVGNGFRQLPPRSKRGLAMAAAMSLLLAGYVAYSRLPVEQEPDASAPVQPEAEGDRSEAVIVVEPLDPNAESEPAASAVEAETGSGDGDAATQEAEASPEGPGPLVWPTQGEVLTRHGWGHSETMADWRYHSGVDLAAAEGDEVVAAEAGTVTEVRLDPQWGWVIEIEHAAGYRTRYASLARTSVSVGDEVSRGEVIGLAGSTAASESALPTHVHFEVIWQDETVDPLTLLPAGS